MSDGLVVVTGGGGFIGGHLIRDLVGQGMRVRAVDMKPLDEWYQVAPGAESRVLDLSERAACEQAVAGASRVYNLAADMGGMGFIENNKALCMLSVLINTHMLMAAHAAEVERFFFSSSACVYAADRQTSPDVTALAESDAYPAMPEDGYGWEKLFSERMCRHFLRGLRLRRRALLATTTSTAHSARTTAAVRRRPPRSAARSSRPSLRVERDRDLGRRRADAELHVRG